MSERKTKQLRRERERSTPTPDGTVAVNFDALAPFNSCGPPYFVELGY